jgi:predicted DsbA family dithiol-disulfide isomerase
MIQSVVSLAALLMLGGGSLIQAGNCPALSAEKQSGLVDYARKQYKIDSTTEFRLAKTELVESSCYRALTFEGKGPLKTWQLTLYLSPDQRFLTGELFDTTLDPIEQERRKAEALMAGLVLNRGSRKGPDDAPVTIVEFSDFECPYCRGFTDIMKQLTPAERTSIQVVFHHLPLQMHPWARTAAEGAACAQLQNADAFWSIHDQLFDHQTAITRENVHELLLDFAKSAKSLNLVQFQDCLDNQMSLGLVLRDLNLASANNVNGTPTLFINGQRIQGIKDASELRRLLAEAKKSSGQMGVANDASSSR